MDRDSLLKVIQSVHERFQMVPEDQVDARICISQLLEVVSQYQDWSNEMKAEVLKLMQLNSQQAIRLGNYKKMLEDKPRIISPEDKEFT